MHWRLWRGIVLHERVYGRGDTVSVDHEPSDLRYRSQWLHRLRIIYLHKWGVHWCRRCGIVLHERVYSRGDLSVEHYTSDLRRGGQWMHRRHYGNLLERAGLRALWNGHVRRSELERVATAQQSGRGGRRCAKS